MDKENICFYATNVCVYLYTSPICAAAEINIVIAYSFYERMSEWLEKEEMYSKS